MIEYFVSLEEQADLKTMASSSSLSVKMLLYVQLIVLFVSSIRAHEIAGKVVEEENGPREFDYFVLALQWPGTFCQRTRQCCSSNACCRGSNAPAEFTIHGLWPNYNDGTWPACCGRSSFDKKEISTLLDPLEKYWPSLSCGSPSTCHGGRGSFWAHEWEKHGTCSSPVARDEYNYFLTTLNVYFKYNITEVLNEAGYTPSNSEKYPIGGIISAIQNAFHTTPVISCSNGAVEELRLCFYKDFQLRDCAFGSSIQGDVNYSKSSCPKYVSLPAYASMGLEDGGSAISWQPEHESL